MANSNDPTHQQQVENEIQSSQAVAARWPDFYALLSLAPDSADDEVRTRIRQAYMEATANSDHRNIARRIHYQTMVERIVPQARRILLDPQLRAEYDRQLALHRGGDATARDYGEFLRDVPGSSAFGANPTSAVGVPTRQSDSDADQAAQAAMDSATSQAAMFGAADASMEAPTFWSDLAIRDDSVDEKETGEATTAPVSHDVPVVAVAEGPPTGAAAPAMQTIPAPSPQPPAKAAPSFSGASPIPSQRSLHEPEASNLPAAPPSSVPLSSAPLASTAPAAPPASSLPASSLPAAPPPAVAVPEASSSAATAPQAAPVAALQTPDASQIEAEIRARTVPAAQATALANADVVLTPETMRGGRLRDHAGAKLRKRADPKATRNFVSRTVQMLITAIVAAGLTIFILRGNQTPTKIPLRVVYAPDLEIVMQAVRSHFAASPSGGSVELLMQPLDGRAAMQAALAPNFAADVWIPSETLWSDRYNNVAGSKGALALQQSRSLALSPTVLIARGERAALLRKRFPSRLIPSWEALRSAVMQGAPGHFGLGDPVRSGSGAVARYFMAKEWTSKRGRDLTVNTARDSALWRWMDGFEENVPVAARVSSDMVKDLALGTGGRYWWGMALESEAINWIKAGKNLEVWYLPQTNYADHPMASWDRAGGNPATGAARAALETLLRSEEGQKVLLQNGFRPTGIELTVPIPGNPFTDAKLRERGLRSEGFRVVENIRYGVLNELASAWNARNS